MSIERVMNGIRSCAYHIEIDKARSCLDGGDVEGYNRIKLNLPAVTFSATYASNRKLDELVHYNSLLVFDIDKLEEYEMNRIGDILRNDAYIAAYWLSPSARGFKGLIHLCYEEVCADLSLKEKHDAAFEQCFQYLLGRYGIELDKSGRDIQRLCFMSCDTSLYLRNEADVFQVQRPEDLNLVSPKNLTAKPRGTLNLSTLDWKAIYTRNVEYPDHASNRAKITFIFKKLRKQRLSITDSWENWTKVAFAIASSVHPEIGKELFLQLCRLDGPMHDEAKSQRLIWEAYAKNQGACRIQTILYLARQKGIVLDR